MNLKCDRALLEHPSDAIYVEQMCQYLFSDANALAPICTDARLYEVTVSADKITIQHHQLMWAILMIHHRVVSFEDFFVSRRSAVDLIKVPVSKADSEPALSIAWDIFPTVPQWLIEAVDVTPIRALTFFAQTARQAGGKVYQKWGRSLQVELAIHVAVAYFTAWARPVIDQPRIWYLSRDHVDWLKKFADLPPIPAYYEAIGKYMLVSVREVVSILEDTLARATPLTRKDYRTKSMVSFVPTPNSQIYIHDPLKEAVLSPPVVNSAPITAPVPPVATNVSKPVTTVVTVKGVMHGRVLKKESLRKNTKMTTEMVNGLHGSGPWSASDIIDCLVADGARLTTANKGLKEEVSQLRTETQRLREDINRYRGDAARLSDELRNSRDWNYSQLETRRYDDTARGYGSRNAYDPYERRY